MKVALKAGAAVVLLLAEPAAAHEFRIYYGSGEVEPARRYWPTIVEAARYARELKTPVCIVTHTDDEGPALANQALAKRRGAALARWMIALGVRPAAVGVGAQGEAAPAVRGDDGVARQLNRRAVIVHGGCPTPR